MASVRSYCARSFEVTASSRYEILKKLAANIQCSDEQVAWAPIIQIKTTEAHRAGYFSYRLTAAIEISESDRYKPVTELQLERRLCAQSGTLAMRR